MNAFTQKKAKEIELFMFIFLQSSKISEKKFDETEIKAKRKAMKCPQLLNSLVLLQFVIVSLANDEEIDKRRKFNDV